MSNSPSYSDVDTRRSSNPIVSVSGLVSALYFAGSLIALAYKLYHISLILWFLSGLSSATIVNWAFTYYERLHSIVVREYSTDKTSYVPRMNIGKQLAVALSVVAPPSAGLLVLVAFDGLLDIVDYLYSSSGMSLEDFKKSIDGLRIPDLSGSAAMSIIPLALPALVSEAVKGIPLLSCIAFSMTQKLEGILGDKSCRIDIVDIVVWGNSSRLSFDFKSVTE